MKTFSTAAAMVICAAVMTTALYLLVLLCIAVTRLVFP